jgi:hypothetical protein
MKNNNNIIPETGATGKNNPFVVPGDYFESLPGRLQKRLQPQVPAGLSLREKLMLNLRPHVALAAAIAGFAILGYLGIYLYTGNEMERGIREEISEYIDSYHHEFSDHYFLSMLDDDLFPDEDIDFGQSLYPDVIDAYVNYLYQEDIAIDLIMLEL